VSIAHRPILLFTAETAQPSKDPIELSSQPSVLRRIKCLARLVGRQALTKRKTIAEVKTTA
jgi:hypothetical protein